MEDFKSNTFERYKYLKLKEKLLSSQSFLLFGARQTGKSTLLEKIYTELPKDQKLAYYLQLPQDLQNLESDLQLIKHQVDAFTKKPVYVFIDEIQKLPALLNTLQYLIDHKNIVLMASGSSARKMRQQATNWLPGRIHKEHLYPLTWQESLLLENKNQLNHYLLWGFLPGMLTQSDLEQRKKSLESYTALYLEEEVRKEAAVRNLPVFKQFLQIAALESGTSPNFSKIAQQIGVSPPTVAEYYNILEDTLIIHRLPRFGKSRNAVAAHPKNYFFDLGVRNSAAKIGHSEGILVLQQGILFEHLIILEAFAQFVDKSQMSFWIYKKNEVDLIIESENKRIAVEIKSTNKPQAKHFEGLNQFCSKHKTDHSIVVCQINQAQKFGKHLAIPWFEFVERIEDHL